MTRPAALSVTPVFVLSIFFASCATILDGPAQYIRIATDEKIKRVSVDKALFTDSFAREPEVPGTFLVRRSRDTLFIHVQLDSGEKIIPLLPHNSFAFWLNIDANYGLGMLVDWNDPKRYSHSRWNYLALKDTVITLRRFAPVPKGTTRFSLSVPLMNFFSIRSPEGQSTNAGPLGLGVGVDYFYKTDRYVSLSAGGGTSVFADHIGPGYYTTGGAAFVSIEDNYVIGSLELGYGLSFSRLLWSKITLGNMVNMERSVGSTGIGLSFSAQYRFSRYFRFGILYQPTLFSPGLSPSFGYQHYISAGLAWRRPIRKAIRIRPG